MHAIVVSDTHLGWEKSEKPAFLQFLQNLPRLDYLIINGDLYEMWRRDMTGVVFENLDAINLLQRIQNNGTRVVLIAGNHDYHCLTMGPSSRYPLPFQFREEFTLPLASGLTYVFRHGHQYDPSCSNPRENEALCRTGYKITTRLTSGNQLDRALALAQLTNPLNSLIDPNTPYVPIRQTGALASYTRPGVPETDARYNVIRQRARASIKQGTFLMHGHTHVPLLDLNARYADSGSWVEGHRDYIEINDTQVALQSYT